MDAVPNEVLLQVFGHLSYSDLKTRIPYVCKRFSHLMRKTKHGEIDKLLFRDIPESNSSSDPPARFTSHPVFGYVSFKRDFQRTDQILLHRCKCCVFWASRVEMIADDAGSPPCCIGSNADLAVYGHKLRDFDVFHENATSPATDELLLHVNNFAPLMVTPMNPTAADDAVKVSDIMTALVLFLLDRVESAKVDAMQGDIIDAMLRPQFRRTLLTRSRAGLIRFLRSGRYWNGIERVDVCREYDQQRTPHIYVFQKGDTNAG